MPPSLRKSAKEKASGPSVPIPYGPGSEVGCSRIPAALEAMLYVLQEGHRKIAEQVGGAQAGGGSGEHVGPPCRRAFGQQDLGISPIGYLCKPARHRGHRPSVSGAAGKRAHVLCVRAGGV